MEPKLPAAPTGLVVADACDSDLPAIAEIYAAVVADSHATFDLEAPGLAEWGASLAACDPAIGHLLIVARDRSGTVAGYARSGLFMPKRAYSTTVQTSLYVAKPSRRRRVGTVLYEALLERLDASAARLAVAGLAEPNPGSVALHRRFGFTPVGTFAGVGVKFGRAWDVTWYQRSLEAR